MSSSKGKAIGQELQKKVKVVLPYEKVDEIVVNDEEDEAKKTTDPNEANQLKERLARSESIIEELRSKLDRVSDQNDRYLEQNARYESLFASSINSSLHSNNLNQACENSSKEFQSISIPSTSQAQPVQSSKIPDIGGYKLKIKRFLGKEDEDYDVWWADLQAYCTLSCTT